MSNASKLAYSAHDRLVSPLRNRAQIWRLLAGLGIIAVAVVVLNTVLFGVTLTFGSNGQAQTLLAGESPAAMLVILVSFGFVIIGVWLAAKLLQHRKLRAIIGPIPLAIVQFRTVMKALLILGAAVVILPPYGMGVSLEANLALGTWLLLLPLSLCAVLIQVSAEEILFRGYIQQSLAARFRSPVIWLGVPSLIFAAGHYAPGTAGGNAGLVALWSCLFGLFAADLTARSGTLGPAIALHLFNNIIALLFVSLPDSLSGLALYILPYDLSDEGTLRQWLFVDFAMMTLGWLAARIALRR